MWLQEGRKHHYPLKNKCFLFSSIFIFHSLSTTAQLRCNFKQTQPPWPPVWFSPVSTLYSLDQRLKSGVWLSGRHVNEVCQRCQGLHWQFFLPSPFPPCLSYELWQDWCTHRWASLSVFYTSKLFARSNWGDLLCGNIYHLSHSGSWSHDVSTFCLFLLTTQTFGWILGRGIVVISTRKQQPFQGMYHRKICMFGRHIKTLATS